MQKEIGETKAEHSTSNVQRSTSAESDSPKRTFDLEDRLLEYAARIIRLVDSLRNSKSANHIGNQFDQSIRTAKAASEKRSIVAEDPGALEPQTLEVERWTLDVSPQQPPAGPVDYSSRAKLRKPRRRV